MKTKLLFFMLTMAVSIGFASAESGTCGENLTWDLTDGVLTISGTGEMKDFGSGGAPWYSNRSTITTVNIGNGVTSIGSWAFYNCSSLTSITIPNSITSIADRAFYDCSSLKGVYITDLTAWCNIVFGRYGSSPLSYAHNLYLNGILVTDLIIPNGVTRIGYDAFGGCRSLTSVTIPNSVTSIGESAFGSCSSLTSVTIPNSVTSIGESAFYNCSSLTSVTIGNSVTSIGRYAFGDCSGLTSLIIPNSVTSIGNDAFQGIDSVYYSGKATGTPWGANNVFEYYVDGIYKYQDLTKKVLVGIMSTDITEVVIPDGVIRIDDKAFYNCIFLTNVIIPNTVTSIGSEAFYNCTSLTNVLIPESVTNIGSNAFYGIPNIIYTGNATGSPWGARYRNGYVDGYFVYRDENKTDIVRFVNHEGAKNIIIPDGVITISDHAFYECNAESITIPNGVTSIGDYAFSGCSGLTSVTIPNSVTSIGSYAFSRCRSLASVTIPNSITRIGEGAFSNCGLGSIIIPEGVTKIKDYTFEGCGLSNVVIPDGVTDIGRKAFYGCNNLTSVIIPASVSYIAQYAFYNGGRLKKFTLLGCYTYFSSAFDPYPVYSYSTIHYPENIYVPFDCFDKYHQNISYGQYVKLNGLSYVDETTPTSAKIKFNKVADEIEIVSCKVKDGELFEGNTLEFIGLEPNSEYTDVPIVVTSNMGETATIPISFTTSALELTTQPAKPVSANTAILLAETNMADIETSCGFEYKRNDAPADMEGNKVLCPVANGQMAGRLKGLKDDVYYKYRAFYKSSAGNMYYGDWQYIFTGDVAVEFDPILYTYEASNVQETQARLRGYALAGSDDFTEQGFEYWADSRTTPTNIIARAPQATLETIGEHHTIQANGISMSVNLNNLDAGTTYRYRTYAKIGTQTLYGAEMSFTTKGEYTPPTYTITFVNYDNSPLLTLTNVEQGTLPVYTGDTPTRDDDDEYTYTFRGWQPEIVAAEADATYTATYNAAKKTDAIDIISADENSVGPRKIIENGRLYIILPNGKKYTATGEEVR